MNETRMAGPNRIDAKSALLAAAAVEFESEQCLIVDEPTATRIADRAKVERHSAFRYFETNGLQELHEYLNQQNNRPADVPPQREASNKPLRPSAREHGAFVLWQLDRIVVDWLAGRSLGLLQKSLGLIFLWFGVLKFFPGLSPAEQLVTLTINELFGLVGLSGPTTLIILGLALWEVLIGLGFLFDRHRRAVTWMLIAHLPNTALPLILLPEFVWTRFPHQLTIEGQYIVKNLVLLAGGMVIGATVRGGGLISSSYVEVDEDGVTATVNNSS